VRREVRDVRVSGADVGAVHETASVVRVIGADAGGFSSSSVGAIFVMDRQKGECGGWGMDDQIYVEAVETPGTAQLRLCGELDVASRSLVESAVVQLARDAEAETIVVDLAGLTFCDASGLHAFAAGQQEAAAHGKTLVLAHPGPEVQLLLDTVDFGRVVQIRTSGDADSRQ